MESQPQAEPVRNALNNSEVPMTSVLTVTYVLTRHGVDKRNIDRYKVLTEECKMFNGQTNS